MSVTVTVTETPAAAVSTVENVSTLDTALEDVVVDVSAPVETVVETTIGSSTLAVDVDNVTIELNSNALRIKDGGATAAKLASGAALANLGYTPLNRAGDTMTGSLSLGSNDLTVVGTTLLGTTSNPFSNNSPKVHIRNDWTGTETSANRNVLNIYSQAKGAWDTGHFLYQTESRWVDHTSVVEKAITGATRVGTTITVTAAGHGYGNGDRVIVDSVTHTFNQEINGSQVISNVTTNTFDYTVAGVSSGSYTSGGITSNRAGGAVLLGLVAPQVRRGGYSTLNIHADDLAVIFLGNNGIRKATDLIYGAHTKFAAASGTFLDEVEFDTCGSFDTTATYGFLLNGLGAGQSIRASHYGTGTIPEFRGRMARGIFDAPLRTKSGDVLARFSGVPFVAASDVAAATPAGATARIDIFANEDQTATAQGSRIVFYTTALGATVPFERFRVAPGDGIDFFSGTFANYAIRMGDAANAHISFGTTTGNKLGLSVSEKFAFHGLTPVIQRAGAAQVAVVTTASTQTTPWGFSTQAQADAIVTLVNELRAMVVEKGLMKGAA